MICTARAGSRYNAISSGRIYSSFIQASGKRGKRPGINITKNTLGLLGEYILIF